MTKITTIIFDLGGVILNLDQDRTLRAFKRLGADLDLMNDVSTVFKVFETGRISADDFRNAIITHLKGNVTAAQVDDAWNAMLLDLPVERLTMLENLRKKYRVFLLSNTNSIHIDAFNLYLKQHHPNLNWFGLFDKVYYSYQIGLRKPDTNIYEFVLNENNLKPHECLFIDDMKANLNGANNIGLHTILAKNPLDNNMLKEINSLVAAFTASMN
nr:HAD family phosphatase [Bacteroidia bacterium]